MQAARLHIDMFSTQRVENNESASFAARESEDCALESERSTQTEVRK